MNTIKFSKEIVPNEIIDVSNSEVVRIQIKEIEGSLKIKARINPEIDFTDIKIIEDSTYDFIDEITAIGFYTLDTMGYNSIMINCDKNIKGFINGAN